MTNTFTSYETRLILSLRMRDIPGDKIGQIVAEVQAHVAETGEDPEAAFGAPDEYAKQFEGGAKARGAFNKGSFIGIPLIAGGAFAFVQSVFAFVRPDDVPGFPSILGMLLIAIVFVVAGFYFQVGTLDPRKADPVLDPRDGQDMLVLPRRVKLLMAATIALPFIIVLVVALTLD